MNDLTRYFPKELLQVAWEIHSEIGVSRAHQDDGCNFRVEENGPMARELLMESGLPPKELAPTALGYRCLGLMMKQGPVIIRPDVELCRALHQTEIRVSASDFRMPFPIMGVELPDEIAGPHKGSLAVVWKMFDEAVMIWTLSKATHVMYHTTVGDDTPTIEDRLIKAEACDDEDEYRLVVVGGRVAANLCMLASHRATSTTPLSPKTQRHRRARDPRLQQLAAREFQQMTFRDLILKERAPSSYTEGQASGVRMARQHRRRHWKHVVHGTRGSLRRYQWINPYFTSGSDDEPQPTVILQ